jgi:hypothetical protein
MNKHVKLVLGLAVLLLAIGGMLSAVQRQFPPVKLCCVAGNYRGTHICNPLPNCPVPQSETFSMTIMQGLNCGSDVWGTILSASGEVQNFKGTLTRGIRGCCVLTASFGKPGNVTTFTGTFCLKLGKWVAKGTYSEPGNGNPCKQSGTWGVKQI